jgi:hypothetical protein
MAAKVQGAEDAISDGANLAADYLGHVVREHGEPWWWERR